MVDVINGWEHRMGVWYGESPAGVFSLLVLQVFVLLWSESSILWAVRLVNIKVVDVVSHWPSCFEVTGKW